MVNGNIYYLVYGKALLPEDNNSQYTAMRWKRICASRPAGPFNLPGAPWFPKIESRPFRWKETRRSPSYSLQRDWQNWRTSRRVRREIAVDMPEVPGNLSSYEDGPWSPLRFPFDQDDVLWEAWDHWSYLSSPIMVTISGTESEVELNDTSPGEWENGGLVAILRIATVPLVMQAESLRRAVFKRLGWCSGICRLKVMVIPRRSPRSLF